MTDEDIRIIKSCFINGFEFKRAGEEMRAEVKLPNKVETFTPEYMSNLGLMLSEALERSMARIEKNKKYHWHDLCMKPDDLPTDDAQVLVAINYAEDLEGEAPVVFSGYYQEGEWYTNAHHTWCEVRDGDVVVAWKEIEEVRDGR